MTVRSLVSPSPRSTESFGRIPTKCIPNFAGSASGTLIFVAVDGRRPVAVRDAAFGYLSFDGEGRFDAAEWEKFGELMIQAWPSPVPFGHENVPDMRVRLANGSSKKNTTGRRRPRCATNSMTRRSTTGRPEETSSRKSRRRPSRENVVPDAVVVNPYTTQPA